MKFIPNKLKNAITAQYFIFNSTKNKLPIKLFMIMSLIFIGCTVQERKKQKKPSDKLGSSSDYSQAKSNCPSPNERGKTLKLWDIWEYWNRHDAVGATGNSGTPSSCDGSYHLLKGNCTYTLIGTRTIIGAAHCGKLQSHFKMCAGKIPLSLEIQEHFDHSGYNGSGLHDIQIKTLGSDVSSPATQPIPFNVNSSLIQEGLEVTFVGVGNGEETSGSGSTESFPGRKRKGMNSVKQVLNEYMIKFFNRSEAPQLGYATEGAGDSGGPSFFVNNLGIEVVAGVWRGGASQNRTDGLHADWIMEISNFNARPSPTIVPDKFIISNQKSSCLSYTNNTPKLIDKCSSSSSDHQWDLMLKESGLYILKNIGSGLCLGRHENKFELINCDKDDELSMLSFYEIEGKYLFISRPEDLCINANFDSELMLESCSLTDTNLRFFLQISENDSEEQQEDNNSEEQQEDNNSEEQQEDNDSEEQQEDNNSKEQQEDNNSKEQQDKVILDKQCP
ncbi:MAG: trypsin-like serine protease [Oligoflexales bacterium]